MHVTRITLLRSTHDSVILWYISMRTWMCVSIAYNHPKCNPLISNPYEYMNVNFIFHCFFGLDKIKMRNNVLWAFWLLYTTKHKKTIDPTFSHPLHVHRYHSHIQKVAHINQKHTERTYPWLRMQFITPKGNYRSHQMMKAKQQQQISALNEYCYYLILSSNGIKKVSSSTLLLDNFSAFILLLSSNNIVIMNMFDANCICGIYSCVYAYIMNILSTNKI